MKIKLEKVYKKYHNKMVVKGIDFEFTDGIWGLLGPNGAGKTSLIRMLTTNILPNKGRILIDNKDIIKKREYYINKLGYLPQKFGYIKELSLWNYLEYIAALKGIDKRTFRLNASMILEKLSLIEYKDKKIDELSGGMKRRVGIAQALLNNPEILILDEPTVGLDIEERRKFREIITEYSKNRLVIISTHIVSDIEFIANKIVIMNGGEIIESGRPERLVSKIEGKIFEGIIEGNDLKYYQKHCRIINYHNLENNRIKIRAIDKSGKLDKLESVKANLEDFYLYSVGMQK